MKDIVTSKCAKCNTEFQGYLIDGQWKPEYCFRCWCNGGEGDKVDWVDEASNDLS